ncbi:MAG TPA: hypothetical protein VJZ71_18285 [Phycisphaerae bacterium]|nr:hypothetical protein [Phycisphaerae bacterium]
MKTLFLGLSEALRLLFPVAQGLPPGRSTAWSRSASWIVPLGLFIGLIWAGLFRITWRVYGEAGNVRVIPALAIVLIECLLTGPFLALGLARTAHLLTGIKPLAATSDARAPLSPVGTLVLCLTVLSEWVLIASIRDDAAWWPSPKDWRSHFNFMYPAPIYRPLLLAPIWGRWGLLLAASVGRTARGADEAIVALCESMRPARMLRHAIVPVALTAIYFSREGNIFIGLIMALIVFAATYIVAVVMAQRGGGQSRQTLFAAGQIAQLAFLAVCRAMWPLIYG